jgi:hypothetical protein
MAPEESINGNLKDTFLQNLNDLYHINSRTAAITTFINTRILLTSCA